MTTTSSVPGWRRCWPAIPTSRSSPTPRVGRTAIRLARELRPDVVLMDLRMPDLEGPAATRAIVEHDPTVRVLALTVASDASDVASAIVAGACGYLLKASPIDDVVEAVRASARG